MPVNNAREINELAGEWADAAEERGRATAQQGETEATITAAIEAELAAMERFTKAVGKL